MDTPRALQTFTLNGDILKVTYVETLQVTTGVECDIYTFTDDPTKDLAIIRIQPGSKTPLQRILEGEETIEGHISGNGTFTVTRENGNEEVYTVGDEDADESGEQFLIPVMIGDVMQWKADDNSALVAFEVCTPPYKDGRFENIG